MPRMTKAQILDALEDTFEQAFIDCITENGFKVNIRIEGPKGVKKAEWIDQRGMDKWNARKTT